MSDTLNAPANAHWYVAQIKPNGFDRAVANLAQQGFESFMPMQQQTVRHARQLKNVLRPVFPGYLFIRFGDDRADWRKINSTFGISRLVSFEKATPAQVPGELIAGFKVRCGANNCLQPPNDMEIGEKVRMVGGAFVGFIGEIETFVGEDRIRLLYEFMGQKSRIDIPAEDLERL